MILSTVSAGRFLRVVASSLMLNATFPLDVLAQTTPAAVAQPATGQPFNAEQLDALVASIALYPDDLLTQLLMASTFPLEVVAAARWVEDPANKSLSGDALVKALQAQSWDPSVKSLVPFPVGTGNLERQSAVVTAARLCVCDAAGRRVRRRAAPSTPGPSERQTAVVAPAGREHAAGDGRGAGWQQPASRAAGGNRHRTGAVGHSLRAEL